MRYTRSANSYFVSDLDITSFVVALSQGIHLNNITRKPVYLHEFLEHFRHGRYPMPSARIKNHRLRTIKYTNIKMEPPTILIFILAIISEYCIVGTSAAFRITPIAW